VTRRHGPHADAGQRPEAAAIEAACPGWRVWLSDHHRWYAVRQGPGGRWTPRGGDITVDADDAAGLRAALAAQAELELAAAS
jgi:hypothetical protein